jgi:uncharacterized protein YjbI with pentapeptide repeats
MDTNLEGTILRNTNVNEAIFKPGPESHSAKMSEDNLSPFSLSRGNLGSFLPSFAI